MMKIFSFLAIAAVATTMFTSCGDDDNGGKTTSSEAKLTLSVDKPTVEVAAKGEFTVTSDIDAPEAILITVTSDDDKILKVDNASVTITKGQKIIKGTYTGVAKGSAKIKIATATASVTMTIGEVSVTVGGDTPPASEIKKMEIIPFDWGTAVSYDDGIKTAGLNFWSNEYAPYSAASPGLCMDFGLEKAKGAMLMGTLTSGIINITAQEKDAAITFDAMAESISYPLLWSTAYTALATGEDIYLAVACGSFDKTYKDYRAWLKINLKAAGGVENLTVVEAYVCLNDGEFKVGQTE